MTFYNSQGKAIAYTDDGENIYLFDGKPVAYLCGQLVYSFTGAQLGRFEDGWMRDKSGRCVFYTDGATGGGPVKPVKQVSPVKSVRQVRPVRSVKQVPVVKSVASLSWSELSGEQFFM